MPHQWLSVWKEEREPHLSKYLDFAQGLRKAFNRPLTRKIITFPRIVLY